MSERSKRLVSMAILKNSVISPFLDEELRDPHETDEPCEYIPSSTEGTDDENTVYLNLGSSRFNNVQTVQEWKRNEFKNENSCKVETINSRSSRLNNVCTVQDWKPLKFEYENSFMGKYELTDYELTDEIIDRLRKELGSEPEKYTCENENGTISPIIDVQNWNVKVSGFEDGSKNGDIFSSPHLKLNKYKKTLCKYCEDEIVSKHFARHLERKHTEEREVKELLTFRTGSVERKKLLSLIRNEGNLDNAVRGKIIPKKRKTGEIINEKNYAICIHCKGYYKRLSLSRHMKKCVARKKENSIQSKPLMESLIYTACHSKYGELLNRLNVKKEIFSKMLADNITDVATKDNLIIYYGEDLLKRTKNKRSLYHISNKIRECAKFLIQMRKCSDCNNLLSTLKPANFDTIIDVVKLISRYNPVSKSFGAGSLALHFRTTFVALCNLASKLLLRGKLISLPETLDRTLMELERFKNLIETQWATEIGSLALKDLNEKSSVKPKLIPITEDIIKLVKFVETKAQEAFEKLKSSKQVDSYKILVETVLVLTVLHNRKRVGDVQYLEYKSCKEQLEKVISVEQNDLTDSLTESEKIMTQNYKRIISIGKGSRPVTILIPKKLQKYYSLITKLREQPWFPVENIYLFTYPNANHWIDGCSVMRKYALQCDAKYPELLTSNRLRKHIATTTQLLNLRDNEIEQLAKFMGHTVKTHDTFYKLPQDVYQVAKVSKLLQILEKGRVSQFKNKTLDEIDIDMETVDLFEDQKNLEIENGKVSSVAETNCNIEESLDAATNEAENIPDINKSQNESKSTTDVENDHRNSMMIKEKGTRQRWSRTQKELMRSFFKDAIKQKKTLRKLECENFIEQNKSMFEDVSWIRVKVFIYNESKG